MKISSNQGKLPHFQGMCSGFYFLLWLLEHWLSVQSEGQSDFREECGSRTKNKHHDRSGRGSNPPFFISMAELEYNTRDRLIKAQHLQDISHPLPEKKGGGLPTVRRASHTLLDWYLITLSQERFWLELPVVEVLAINLKEFQREAVQAIWGMEQRVSLRTNWQYRHILINTLTTQTDGPHGTATHPLQDSSNTFRRVHVHPCKIYSIN